MLFWLLAAAWGAGAADFGRVSLPLSCKPQVQGTFDEGLALLHSFWYEEAEKRFLKAAAEDPGCGMAYWGAAMTLHHPLWGSIDDEWIKKGREDAKKAQALGAKTERERRFIEAVSSFYAADDLRSFGKRAEAFSAAMQKPYLADPKDVEAGAFYALSLLGSGHREKSADLLEGLLKANPDHPGITHYLIHACDVPSMARRGLDAARRYAQLAPLAPHALHMPSHIFIRLGLWPDVIASNRASVMAARKAVAMGMTGDASQQLHAMDFLEYAYLQIGREDEARRLIEELGPLKYLDADDLIRSRAVFEARYAMELGDWAAAAKLSPAKDAKPWTRRLQYWARTIGAARQGDAASARENFKAFSSLEDAAKIGSPWKRMQVEDKEAAGWLAFAEGKKEQAPALLREAAAAEGEMENERLAIPAAEMLGDMLMLLGWPQEALAQYEVSLNTAPGRFNSLYGAAKASAADKQKSLLYLLKLAESCAGSTSSRPELAEARDAVSRAAGR